jgi:hypothetical protein
VAARPAFFGDIEGLRRREAFAAHLRAAQEEGLVRLPEPPFAGPEGFHRIRHYGLLASADCKSNIARAKELMAAPIPEVDPLVAQDTVDPHATSDHRPPRPCCGGRMIIVEVFARGGAHRGPPPSGAV